MELSDVRWYWTLAGVSGAGVRRCTVSFDRFSGRLLDVGIGRLLLVLFCWTLAVLVCLSELTDDKYWRV